MNFSDVCADLRKLLFPAQETRSNTNQTDSTATFDCVPWSWLVKNVVLLLEKYPSGLTKPVILSELQQMWDEVSIEWQRGTSRKSQTINSIYDTLTLQTDAILELWITSVKQLPGTKTTWIATLSDRVSEHQIAWYIHRRFFPLITNSSPLFKPGRLLRMTNCKLFDTSLSVDELSMLPTEHLVIILESHEMSLLPIDTFPKTPQDVIDTFIKFSRTPNSSFYLMGEIRSKGKVEIFRLNDDDIPSKRLKLSISCPTTVSSSSIELLRFNFVIEEKDFPLRRFFKKGDRLILENPTIKWDTFSQTGDCFYGSNTILYLIPREHEKEVLTMASQRAVENVQDNLSRQLSTATSGSQTSQTFRVPIDENGNVDLKYFSEQIFVRDLKPKMSNISLLGRILHIQHNIPLIDGENRRERFGILFEDTEGTCVEITMWDSVGFRCARYRPGQLIFLTGIQSPDKTPKECKKNVTLNGALAFKTEVFNSMPT